MPVCPLCKTHSKEQILKHYYRCDNCDLRFLDPSQYLNTNDEKHRYLLHNNDIHSLDYQKFTQPVVDLVLKYHTKDQRGLDFGAGAGPVASYMLEQLGFTIDKYDPYFWPEESVFSKTYDYIISTEVVEHLKTPYEEFLRLRRLLKPQSNLFVKTVLYDSSQHFENWYYRKDPTHIVFYSQKTMSWIQTNFNFSKLSFYSHNITHFEC